MIKNQIFKFVKTARRHSESRSLIFLAPGLAPGYKQNLAFFAPPQPETDSDFRLARRFSQNLNI
jgi:hypothetical protein